MLCCLLTALAVAQTRSTQIETIDGKKYYIHKIEKNQSLYAISKLYQVSIDEIYTSNPILKKGINAYQEIKIPFVAPVANTGNFVSTGGIDTLKYIAHKVSKGETVYSICNKFALTDKQLFLLNPTAAQGIKEDQWLCLGEKIKKKSPVSAPNKENKPTYTVKEAKQISVAADSSASKPVSKPKKSAYSIALVLPFRLDDIIAMDIAEAVKNKVSFPMVPALAYDFYLGFVRACDSLKNKDFEPIVQVFDIDDKDSLKLLQFANELKTKNFDMIFGPLFANGFKTVAKKAKDLHIPIVSPLTRENKILYNNIYASKTSPSKYTLLESLADYCMDSLKTQESVIMLMMPPDKEKKEVQYALAFKKYYNERLKQKNKSVKDTLVVIRVLSKVKEHLKSNARSIVVSLSTNEVFIADFTTQLAIMAEKKDVVLCGWESIRNMDNIDQAYLNQLNFSFPHEYQIANLNAFDNLNNGYKSHQNTLPGEYYYVGFENAMYYLKLLKELGPDYIHSLQNHPQEGNYMRFNFVRPDITTGFDNRGVYIFKYNNFQVQKTGWK
jgi:LysM repeat protein